LFLCLLEKLSLTARWDDVAALNEARRIASNIAKLPELLGKS
jgi:hypothetical protein